MDDRPRERLLRLGPGALTDGELLALFIEELMEDQSPMALAALPHTARRAGARADEAA